MNNPESDPLFDNPLMQVILTKEEVAKVFRRSVSWVSRMMACGAMPFHYVGDEAMFYSEEILATFLNDSLAKPRRGQNDTKKAKQERDCLRSIGQDRGAKDLSEIRLLSGSRKVG